MLRVEKLEEDTYRPRLGDILKNCEDDYYILSLVGREFTCIRLNDGQSGPVASTIEGAVSAFTFIRRDARITIK